MESYQNMAKDWPLGVLLFACYSLPRPLAVFVSVSASPHAPKHVGVQLSLDVNMVSRDSCRTAVFRVGPSDVRQISDVLHEPRYAP
jgi:hypothetical protein